MAKSNISIEEFKEMLSEVLMASYKGMPHKPFVAPTARSGTSGSPTKAVDDTISSLSKLNETIDQSVKQWVKAAQRNATRLTPGSAMRDAHDDYVESLKNLAESSNKYSRQITEGYISGIKKYKGNFNAQQKLYNRMQSYSDFAAKLKTATSIPTDPEEAKKYRQSDEQKEIIKDSIREANSLRASLRRFGISINKLREGTDENGNLLVENAYELELTDEAFKKLREEAEKNANNFAHLASEEQYARKKFIDGIWGSVKAIAFSIPRAVDKYFGSIAQARVQNLQTTNDMWSSAMRGMSAEENAEWKNANSQVRFLLKDSADDVRSGMESSLQTFGYFGTQLQQIMTQLSNVQFNVGIRTSAQSTEQLQVLAAEIQKLTGKTADEARADLMQVMSSPAFSYAAQGKNDQEKIAIARDQALTLKRVALYTGQNSDYAEQMLQDSVNSRHQSLIDQVKGSIVGPMFWRRFAAQAGMTLPSEEDSRKMHFAYTNPAQFLSMYGKDELTRIQLMSQDIKAANARARTSAIGEGLGNNRNIGGFLGLIPGEQLGNVAGYDMARLDDEGARGDVAQHTRAAVAGMDTAVLVDNAKKSLTAIEAFYNRARQRIEGGGKSVIGAPLGATGMFMSNMLGSVVGNMLGHGVGKILGRGLGRAGGRAGLKLFGRGGIRGRWGVGRGLISSGATRIATGGRALLGLGGETLSAFGSAGRGIWSGISGLGRGALGMGRSALTGLRGMMSLKSALGLGKGLLKFGKASVVGAVGLSMVTSLFKTATTSWEEQAKEFGMSSAPTSFFSKLTLAVGSWFVNIGKDLMDTVDSIGKFFTGGKFSIVEFINKHNPFNALFDTLLNIQDVFNGNKSLKDAIGDTLNSIVFNSTLGVLGHDPHPTNVTTPAGTMPPTGSSSAATAARTGGQIDPTTGAIVPPVNPNSDDLSAIRRNTQNTATAVQDGNTRNEEARRQRSNQSQYEQLVAKQNVLRQRARQTMMTNAQTAQQQQRANFDAAMAGTG